VVVQDRASRVVVLCRIGRPVCALALEHVEEVLRPLAVDPLPDLPPAVTGVTVLRGVATPVVDGRTLLGHSAASPPTRWVSLKAGPDRRIALAVDEVVGVRAIAREVVAGLPPLLRDVDAGAPVAALGALDTDLLLVLQAAYVVPDTLWARVPAPVAEA
jgi:purine-binding chemotaxis protein CheW